MSFAEELGRCGGVGCSREEVDGRPLGACGGEDRLSLTRRIPPSSDCSMDTRRSTDFSVEDDPAGACEVCDVLRELWRKRGRYLTVMANGKETEKCDMDYSACHILYAILRGQSEETLVLSRSVEEDCKKTPYFVICSGWSLLPRGWEGGVLPRRELSFQHIG